MNVKKDELRRYVMGDFDSVDEVEGADDIERFLIPQLRVTDLEYWEDVTDEEILDDGAVGEWLVTCSVADREKAYEEAARRLEVGE